MKNKIIFATGNKGKVKEIQEILKDLNYEVLTMKEVGMNLLMRMMFLCSLEDLI